MGLLFGISQEKTIENFMTNTILILGTALTVAIGIIIKKKRRSKKTTD